MNAMASSIIERLGQAQGLTGGFLNAGAASVVGLSRGRWDVLSDLILNLWAIEALAMVMRANERKGSLKVST